MRLGAGDRGDALHEVKYAFGWPAFLGQNRGDDLRRLRFAKAALA